MRVTVESKRSEEAAAEMESQNERRHSHEMSA